jgi:hypothetical protein
VVCGFVSVVQDAMAAVRKERDVIVSNKGSRGGRIFWERRRGGEALIEEYYRDHANII